MQFEVFLTRHWTKSSSASGISVTFAVEGSQLTATFIIHEFATIPEEPEPGSFCEGLWEEDCMELFIAKPDGSYFEWNIAPSLAWWCCEFSSPRERRQTRPDLAPKLTRELACDATIITFQLDLAPLEDIADLSWNLTAILYRTNAEFYSLANLPGNTPDFHQPSVFLPLCSSA